MSTRFLVEDQLELAQRKHIHHLLDDYAVKHLTTPHEAWSTEYASQLLEIILVPVPEHDPHDIQIPEDPFDALSRVFGLKNVPETLEEKLVTTPESLAHLRSVVAFLNFKGRPKTERVWNENSELEIYRPIAEPMSPILSRRAIRETPDPGAGRLLQAYTRENPSYGSVLPKLKPVPLPDVEELRIPSIEDALNLRLNFTQTEVSAMMAQLRTTNQELMGYIPAPDAHMKWFREDSSIQTSTPARFSYEDPDAPFIPIFARRDERGSTNTTDRKSVV